MRLVTRQIASVGQTEFCTRVTLEISLTMTPARYVESHGLNKTTNSVYESDKSSVLI